LFLGIGFEKDFLWRKTSLINLSFKLSQASYKPDPQPEYPFQNNLSVYNAQLGVDWQNESSPWAFGLLIESVPQVTKVEFEKVKAEQRIMFGPQVTYKLKIHSLYFKTELSLPYRQNLYGLRVYQQILYFPFNSTLFTGLEFDLQNFMASDYKTQIYDGFINLGFQF
jgi:hypothetical protein